jgi:serine/threonine protein kinase
MLHLERQKPRVKNQEKYKYKLNKEYEKFDICGIKEKFDDSNIFLHNERNKIKKINHFVVKSFKVPNLLNSIIYTFFKKSKAKKSYENSKRCGIFTPNPVGFIEFYESKLLSKSFFISEDFNFDWTIREFLLNSKNPVRKSVFRAFSRFCFNLHQNKIFHLDFSPGNILIKKIGEDFEFKIVDVNRMKFGKLDTKKRALAFAKLWAEDKDLEIIIKEYLKFYEDKDLLRLALKESQKHKDRVNLKKIIKRKLKK